MGQDSADVRRRRSALAGLATGRQEASQSHFGNSGGSGTAGARAAGWEALGTNAGRFGSRSALKAP